MLSLITVCIFTKMARKIYRKRYYKQKGRWSSNIKTLTQTTIQASANTTFIGVQDLCVNPIQEDSRVSNIYTVKNVELSYELECDGDVNFAEGLTSYIMFVPQGMTVAFDYPNQHPEYIMAYKFLGSPNLNQDAEGLSFNPGRNPQKIRTRLARRLQTGDRLILLVIGQNILNEQKTLKFNGLVRWWTKAN